MATEGIQGFYVETRNYGATAAFWSSLGYRNAFETDHGSGQWEHPAGGPFVFIVEQHDRELQLTPTLGVTDAKGFGPSREPDYVQHFEPTHWGTLQALVRDPDGRVYSLEAPMTKPDDKGPESTAARVALWRATHVRADPPPHVLEDEVGLRLLGPEPGWEERPDLRAEGTRLFRASVVARSRFIEDFVAASGVGQYVILGAGLDTFAQRRPAAASGLTVYEIDQPGPQAWKRGRLEELGYGVPRWLRFVPVDFEAAENWEERLVAAGFDRGEPAVVVSTGVSMYLTREATLATLRQVASLAPGSTFVMTFMRPVEEMNPEARALMEWVIKSARESGTPFVSFYSPAELVELAREAGFSQAEHVPAETLNERYFAGRDDGLRTSNAEELVVAKV